MKGAIILLMIFFLVPMVNAVCITPTEGMEINDNTIFCFGAYNLENGIKIANSSVILDCNSSVLVGNGIGYGILLKNVDNARIQNCNISNFEVGIYLDNSANNLLNNNYLTKNKFGIALFNSFNNDIDDNVLLDNIRESTINLQSSLIQEEQSEVKEEIAEAESASPKEIMLEVIKLKKPFLGEDEILREVNSILDKYFNFTRENLEITREIAYNETDRSTQIKLNLKPKKTLLNVSVYEKIPKCVSNYVNEILFITAGYEVINDEPLILWAFAKVDKEEEISYKVSKRIDEECKNLLTAFGIATGFEEFEEKTEEKRKSNYLVIALVIILFALILNYLYKKQHKKFKK
ncbi:right-handed parallel beta-helix repeat-containing protein [Candidatus Woesearchaeota archaeon]|nr:right-handed parallel beta-helix repeat-containing protein [Candidatus Woesearchaeota archaeon]